MTKQDQAKIAAGKAAIEQFVFDGMKIGLGSGTTSHFFVRLLGEKMREGLGIMATTTSRSTIEVTYPPGRLEKVTRIDYACVVVQAVVHWKHTLFLNALDFRRYG